MSTWTLADIQSKVRKIVGSPGETQLSTADLNTAINNYYAFTMPFELKEQVTLQFIKFQTLPGINVYPFPGAFLTDQPMAYADGFPLIFYQDPDIFYQDWPQEYAMDMIGSGNGSTTSYSGSLINSPVIVGSVMITDGLQILTDSGLQVITVTVGVGNGSTVTYTGTLGFAPIQGGTLSFTDSTETFTDNGNGILVGSAGGTGTIVYSSGVYSITFNAAPATGVNIVASYQLTTGVGVLTGNGTGTINYTTGAYSVTFASAPTSSSSIYSKYLGYSGSRPQGVLFFKNQFTFMPVPDQVYVIQMQGYINPTQLVNTTDTPIQEEWGQLIAYGASVDIFSDRGDLAKYNEYFPLLKRYENVALARTVQQYQAEQSVPRF